VSIREAVIEIIEDREEGIPGNSIFVENHDINHLNKNDDSRKIFGGN